MNKPKIETVSLEYLENSHKKFLKGEFFSITNTVKV